jgi:oxygen-independent coproporphyrinogen-3 oxidase
MYLMLCEKMRAAGYEHYEISNFARPGFRSRHNSRYWKQEEYLGFGPGAHSDFGGKRMESPRSLPRWMAGEWREEDSEIDRAAEYLMLALRTSDGVDAIDYQKNFGRDFAPIQQSLEPLQKAGYVQRQETRWSLTENGFLLSNPILVSVLEAAEKSDRQYMQEEQLCEQ